jgi:hypothetical protein
MVVGGLVMALKEAGVILTDNSILADNGYENDSTVGKFVDVNVKRTHKFSSYLVTRNSSNVITNVTLIKDYEVKQETTFIDYHEIGRSGPFSKATTHILNEIGDKSAEEGVLGRRVSGLGNSSLPGK